MERNAQGIGVRGVTRDFVSKLKIPLPSLHIQRKVIEKIQHEEQLVNSNKQLIEIYEQKIKDEINKLWQPAQKEKVYEMVEERVGMVAEE